MLGGWAVFILWLGERQHVRMFLIALGIAAVVAIALEHLREVIREGHGELERCAFWLVGVSIVLLVVVCELFAHAFAHSVQTWQLLPSVLAALVGPDAAEKLNPWWGLGGLLGIWSFMGVAAAQWVVGIVDATPDDSGRSGAGAVHTA